MWKPPGRPSSPKQQAAKDQSSPLLRHSSSKLWATGFPGWLLGFLGSWAWKSVVFPQRVGAPNFWEWSIRKLPWDSKSPNAVPFLVLVMGSPTYPPLYYPALRVAPESPISPKQAYRRGNPGGSIGRG